LAKLYTLSI